MSKIIDTYSKDNIQTRHRFSQKTGFLPKNTQSFQTIPKDAVCVQPKQVPFKNESFVKPSINQTPQINKHKIEPAFLRTIDLHIALLSKDH